MTTARLLVTFLAAFGCAAAASARTAHADGEYDAPAAPPAAKDVTEVGPAAAFDRRLPPVIPGEEINHNGRKTRVWSSSGPVPVSKEPEPWNRDDSIATGEGSAALPLGVIIDKRDERRR